MMVWTSQGNKTLRLSPGIVQISDEDLDFLMPHPTFKEYVERGWLKIMEDVTQDSQPKKTDNKYLSVKDILESIDTMTDKEQLKKYAKDNRKKIAESAEDRLKILKVEIKTTD